MLAFSPEEVLKIAIQFDVLQDRLLQGFFLKITDASDLEFLTDFPKSGAVEIDGGSWTYKKHGLGYVFLGKDGSIVDVHNRFERGSRVIDAHRLAEYVVSLNSGGVTNEAADLYLKIENSLKNLEGRGVLRRVKIAPPAWELVTSKAEID
ncbi:DUF6896 domain-containing protein [Variovorax sp. CF313]|uniref:DUF6896 domain-containing protein n=1 Tax=Variovorax sp. CF313 TaxID=1144315 RepID=UPI0012F7248C|nr:hypothetical protein [Variovorax sp. CF313]